MKHMKTCIFEKKNLNHFLATKMHHAFPLKNWFIVYPRTEADAFRRAKDQILKVAKEFGMDPKAPTELVLYFRDFKF